MWVANRMPLRPKFVPNRRELLLVVLQSAPMLSLASFLAPLKTLVEDVDVDEVEIGHLVADVVVAQARLKLHPQPTRNRSRPSAEILALRVCI